MNKIILTLYLFICIFQTKAQTFEKLINENKLDTFAFFKTPSSIVTFLFWTKQNKYYLSREVLKQKSTIIETVISDSLSPLLFYLLNRTTIDTSIIRPFTYLKNVSSMTRSDTFTLSIAHNSKYEWDIYRNQELEIIYLKDFDLWEGSIRNESNIYSVYNNSQPIALFFKKTEELLSKMGWTK